MNLPVLPAAAARPDPTPADVWRRFTDILIDHAAAAGEEVPVRVGRLMVGDDAASRLVPGVAVLPYDGATPDALAGLLAACDERGCARPRVLIAPETAELLARGATGYTRRVGRVMRLQASPATDAAPSGLLVLPVRAARAAYERWCGERAADEPDAVLLPRHLDDPQYDAVVALRGGEVVGVAALQIRGQTGLICDVDVRPADRRCGIAGLLLRRIIDVAARAQLSDVFTAVPSADVAATATMTRAGFVARLDCEEWTPLGRPD